MPKNINKFTIHTLVSFCPVDGCETKYSGKEKEVIKLMKMHMKYSHRDQEFVILGSHVENRSKLYKDRQKTDNELRNLTNILN